MKPSAVLLIDLENFYCSREDYCRNGPPPGYDRNRFGYDLDKLLSYARAMTADRSTGVELPFTVKRAYADFNVAKYPPGAPPQYYLRQLPDELLSQGVEPVQVFRLSRGGGGRGSKNAADMRMAMDAVALLATGGHVEHFILVTGDADFIPVILELKRHGHTVSVIGVTGATSPKIQRFVDNFELFEDLLAAEEVEARTGEQALAGDALARVAAAVRRLLARTHPLRFAAVKPLLSKELGHPFDPGLFGCDTTGDFLRENQNALGVVIRQGPHDSEIDLPGSAPNCTNGTSSRVAPRPPARAPEKPAAVKQAGPGPEPHTAAHYRQLLVAPRGASAEREGKVTAVPWAALVWTCDAIVPLLTPPTGEPTHTTKLLPKLIAAADSSALPELVRYVRLFYPTLRAGLPVQGTDGVYVLPPEMTGEQIRYSVLRYIAFVLKCRLGESGASGDIAADQLAAVFEPGAALEDATAEFAAALAEPVPEPQPAPVPNQPAKSVPSVEEVHTAAGYVKLLKAGGPKGSETESFKVLPVPWPSVERVCADAYALLSPAAEGGPLPREQFNARLLEAGKELCLGKYDQHVRRVLGILRLAGDLAEENGLVALSADVISAHDLRSRALAFLLQLLQLRLEERGTYDPIRPQPFVAALEAGPFTEQLLEEVAPAIEWLYRPPESEPGSDSSVDIGRETEPTVAEPGVPAPVPTCAEPGAGNYTFDGALPEIDTGNDPIAPELRHEPLPPTAEPPADRRPQVEVIPQTFASAPAEVGSGEFATLDLAEITSAAVAEHTSGSADGPAGSVEPIAVALPATESPISAERPTVFAAEETVAIPVAELLPEDPLFAALDADRPIVLAEPEPIPPVPLHAGPPLFSREEQVAPELDRMKPPPLPARRVTPPPLPVVHRAPHDEPQPPPESA